jgi:hypothetical protein
MTAQGPRRPVTARDFNRLLFALLLLGALTVLARLVTRQETHAADAGPDRVSLAQWVQTADALFVRGEWSMAADAYFGALEIAASQDAHTDPRLLKKLAISLHERGDHRIGIHFMRLYHARLIRFREERFVTDSALDGLLRDPGQLEAEVLSTEQQLKTWDVPY